MNKKRIERWIELKEKDADDVLRKPDLPEKHIAYWKGFKSCLRSLKLEMK